MSSLTTNFNFYLPELGDGAQNGHYWGAQVNQNFTDLDTLVQARVTKIDPRTTGTYQHGTAPDYFELEADGTPVMHGAATVWDDINISLVPPQGKASTPAIIPFNGDARLDCYAFSGTNPTPDEIHSSLEVLHGYLEGSDIHFHLHWYPTDTNTGNVVWQLRYAWFNPGTVPPAATTVAQTVAVSGVAWQEQTTAFVISGSGKKMGSRFVFSLFRDATDPGDTYAHNAAVTDMGIHYQQDTIGSRLITTK